MKTMRMLTIILVLGLLAVAGRGLAQAGGSQFDTLIAPQAGTKQNQGTTASSINSQGDIVGYYFDRRTANHGFLLQQDHYSSLDAPQAGTKKYQDTIANGLNSQGDIVGNYVNAYGVSYGFLLHRA